MTQEKQKYLMMEAAKLLFQSEYFQKELNEACTTAADTKMFNDLLDKIKFNFDLIKVNLTHMKP